MSYTTYSEVQSDFKNITFGATGNVTSSDVTQFITEADALINAYVGARYTVPVTSGDGLNLLKFLSRSLVTARIKKILEVKNEKNAEANQNVVGVLLSPKQVMDILTDIKDDKISLAGAVDLVSNSGFYSYNSSESIEPVIEKETTQW